MPFNGQIKVQSRSERSGVHFNLDGFLICPTFVSQKKKEKNLPALAIDIQSNNNLFNQSSINGRFLARNVFFILKRTRGRNLTLAVFPVSEGCSLGSTFGPHPYFQGYAIIAYQFLFISFLYCLILKHPFHILFC